jgi:Na+/H+-translocating membrane pyrophosphatase
VQVIMAVLIFALLGSVTPEGDRVRADELKNGLFSMIAFLLGATTSILCGYLGMKIATYANARTAVEARKGIAPAFMCGECWGPQWGLARGVLWHDMPCGAAAPQLLHS